MTVCPNSLILRLRWYVGIQNVKVQSWSRPIRLVRAYACLLSWSIRFASVYTFNQGYLIRLTIICTIGQSLYIWPGSICLARVYMF